MAPTICDDDDFEPRLYHRLVRQRSVINYAAGRRTHEASNENIENLNHSQRIENKCRKKKCENVEDVEEEEEERGDSMDSTNLMSFHNYAKRRKSNDENRFSSTQLDENSVLSMSSLDEDLNKRKHKYCSLPPQSLVSTAPIASTTEMMSLYHRFTKAPQTCQQRNLFEIAIKTIGLLQRNRSLQLRLRQLQMETRHFVDSVMSNPENAKLRPNDNLKALTTKN